MNTLSRDQQIAILSAITEGVSLRAATRLTGTDRKTVARLALRVGRGCAELHDRMMVGVRTGRLELDELWAFVGKKQKRVKRTDSQEKGDQYTFVALASTSKAIVSYLTGKRDTASTDLFIQDLRQRVLGQPELNTDGFLPYLPAIRDGFGKGAVHGQIIKTYSVVDLRPQASVRYSPCEVVAVERAVVSGVPMQISTSHVERNNLSIRMGCRRFTRLTNAFSKRLPQHVAAVALYVAHYNLCRVHETIRTTPAVAQRIADHVWSIGELLDAALALGPVEPINSPTERRLKFRVIEGGKLT
jgi:IS1 family transposase